jgi:hypothetical protein
VTELEILRRRRELVLLSAQLQRATLVRRLDRIQSSPVRSALGLASGAVSIPLLWRLGNRAFDMALRAYQRRSPRRRHFNLFKLH